MALAAQSVPAVDSATSTTVVNGTHYTPNLGDGYKRGEGLGRHYFPWAPDRIVQTTENTCFLWPIGLNPYPLTCPGECRDIVLDVHALRQTHNQGVINPGPYAGIPGKSILITNGIDRGYINSNGNVVTVPGIASVGLENALANWSHVYAPAVEPSIQQGLVYKNVQGVIITVDGTAVVDSVVATPTGLDLLSPNPGPLVGYGPLPRSTGLTPRGGVFPVFSRTLGAVFLIRGNYGPNCQCSGDIWMVGEDPSPVLIDVPGYEPMTVMAATVGSADRMLWILDSRLDSQQSMMVSRLVRINLLSLEHQVIWEGPRNWDNFKHWLTVDRDGHVLLTASSWSMDYHNTIRIEAHPYVLGTEVPTAMQYGPGHLMVAPLVDSEGYFFVTRGPDDYLHTLRVPVLDPPSSNGIYLGDCM